MISEFLTKGWAAILRPKVRPTLAPHFDVEFYLSQNPDVAETQADPLDHFIEIGWHEERDPAPWFSVRYYLENAPDVRKANINPFFHYLCQGKAEGRSTTWPEVDPGVRALVESEFDEGWYRSFFASEAVPDDLIDHYLSEGWRDGLDPTSWFSTRYYLAQYPDIRQAGVNPFVHYLQQGRLEKRRIWRAGGGASEVYAETSRATGPGPDFEELDPQIGDMHEPQVKALAYYLPQFHSIPENDEFWGPGFTEWRNVARGQPRFQGHVQPRVPRDLGHYCLDDPEVMRKQIDMARAAGLFGFCFYYYWFGGRRVLEKPIEHLMADPSLDFPFCLMWANENWTRTWDGLEKEVLLQQDYDAQKDDALVADLARHFQDSRYIRLDGRPLWFIYRPGHIPDARETIARWRELLRSDYDLDPVIMMVQGFGDYDPRPYGLDGAIEFPPHKICEGITNVTEYTELLDPSFSGMVVRYDEVVERALAVPTPEFPLIRTITPYWDNEARRPGRSMIMDGSTPAKFQLWAKESGKFARSNPVFGESIIAVNAWNEWAEGAYLEPDVYYGGAYLNALSRAVYGVHDVSEGARRKVVLVGHDAYQHGAQILVANLARTMSEQLGVEVVILLCADGPMMETYQKICETHVLGSDTKENMALIQQLVDRGFSQAIVNTTVSGWVAPLLKEKRFHVTSLIHELGRLIQEYNLKPQALAIADQADRVIFPADIVRASFEEVARPLGDKAQVRPQGIYRRDMLTYEAQGNTVRKQLGIPASAKLVINVGYADLRKGFDRFIEVGQALAAERDDVWFVWIGNLAADMERWVLPDVRNSAFADRFHFVGHVDEIERWYAEADVFFLSAREDPFPSVVLEALGAGLPVVGYEGTGGCDKLIRDYGVLVSFDAATVANQAIQNVLDLPADAQKRKARARRAEVYQNYSFDLYCVELLSTPHSPVKTVSVILPNFNYEDHLQARLETIFAQSHPVLETIVLDDASTDDSLQVIRRVAKKQNRAVDLIVNSKNSGSPFKQWRKGLEKARGEYVWIAEADDVAEPEMLETLISKMQQVEAGIGFVDSWQLDEHNHRLGDSYRFYFDSIEPGSFDESFVMEGPEFLKRFLAIKNIILNVSGVVFRRDVLLAAMEAAEKDLDDLSVAGDWRLYCEICGAGHRVVFEKAALNGHRRHSTSVTHALKVEKHLAEIEGMHRFANSLVAPTKDALKQQTEHVSEARAHIEKA